MADQKNRGGQKKGTRQPGESKKKQRSTTQGAGARSDADKRQDQISNPDTGPTAQQPAKEQQETPQGA